MSSLPPEPTLTLPEALPPPESLRVPDSVLRVPVLSKVLARSVVVPVPCLISLPWLVRVPPPVLVSVPLRVSSPAMPIVLEPPERLALPVALTLPFKLPPDQSSVVMSAEPFVVVTLPDARLSEPSVESVPSKSRSPPLTETLALPWLFLILVVAAVSSMSPAPERVAFSSV